MSCLANSFGHGRIPRSPSPRGRATPGPAAGRRAAVPGRASPPADARRPRRGSERGVSQRAGARRPGRGATAAFRHRREGPQLAGARRRAGGCWRAGAAGARRRAGLLASGGCWRAEASGGLAGSARYIGTALKGTAAAERSAERPGDGASPGACAADQITPERPEERPPPAGVRAWLAAGCALSRTGKIENEGSERVRLTPNSFLPAVAGQARPRGGDRRKRVRP